MSGRPYGLKVRGIEIESLWQMLVIDMDSSVLDGKIDVLHVSSSLRNSKLETGNWKLETGICNLQSGLWSLGSVRP